MSRVFNLLKFYLIKTAAKEKIELEDFEEPKNIVCKCGPNEICPVCEEQKDLTY